MPTSQRSLSRRPHSAGFIRPSSTGPNQSIKGQLRCIFSRSASVSRPTTPLMVGNSKSSSVAQAQSHHVEYSKVQRAKRKKNTHIGIDEEKRVMKILHNLQAVERTKTHDLIREELTQLYIKPLPEYIQDKLKKHEERQMSRSAILFEEIFESDTLENSENKTSADKIKLPEQKPLLPSRWQQKMLTKLEKMDKDSTHNSSSASTTPSFRPPVIPTLNRQLQVRGQSSSNCPKTSIQRHKPPPSFVNHIHHNNAPAAAPPPHNPAPPPSHPLYRHKTANFSYLDPLPHPTSYIASKDTNSPFENRILELEKMERDSILIERTSKSKSSSNKETTTRIPAALMQPKYLDSTLAFQSRVAQRKSVIPNSVTRNGRSITPTTARANDAVTKRRNMNMREKDAILQQKRKNSTSNKLPITAK